MTDTANIELTALEVVLDKLEPVALIQKGLELVNEGLLFGSIALVIAAFLLRMVGIYARGTLGEDAEHPGKAFGILVFTCTALILYQYCLDIAVKWANGFYQLYEVADLRQLAQVFDGILDKHYNNLGFWDKFDPGTLFLGLCMLVYGFTAILLILLMAIYGVAHAYCFVLLVILGYIVIPMSLASDKFDLNMGWLRMGLTVLLWPFLEMLVFIISSWIFVDVAQAKELALVDGPDAAAAACLAFTILNCLMCAGVVYAPRMAAAIASSSGDLSPSLEPFGKAGVGAAMAVKGTSFLAFSMTKTLGGNLLHNAISGMSRFASNHAPGFAPAGGAPTDGTNGFDSGMSPKSTGIPPIEIGKNLAPHERTQGINKAMGMNADAGASYKTAKPRHNVGSSFDQSQSKAFPKLGVGASPTPPKGVNSAMGASAKLPPSTQARNPIPPTETSTKMDASQTYANLALGHTQVAAKGVSSALGASPTLAPDQQTRTPLKSDAQSENKHQSYMGVGVGGSSSAKPKNGFNSALGAAPNMAPDHKPRTVLKPDTKPITAEDSSDAQPKATPKPSEKVSNGSDKSDINKAKAKRNAIIRQKMKQDRTVSWKPKGEPTS